jgi:pimeloyl-ACP methyl ester carboxylesterase
MTLGQTLSVMCADDFANVNGDRLAQADPAQPFHATYALEWWRACAKWSVPASALSHDISHVPSLLLSGAYDPVTPPQSAERAISLLSKSQHLIAKQAAHGVTHLGCAPKLIAQFIDQAGAEVLDGRCLDLIASPPFLLDGSSFNITNAVNTEPKP